ncbi:MAG: GAF domain-containing protein [bacterium]|nr:GAF domain-containing protein [bacterium]
MAPENAVNSVEHTKVQRIGDSVPSMKVFILRAVNPQNQASLPVLSFTAMGGKDGGRRRSKASLLRELDELRARSAGVKSNDTELSFVSTLHEALFEISEIAHSAQDMDDVFASLHRVVSELIPAENFFIALNDAATDTLSFPYFVDEHDAQPSPLKGSRGLTAFVIRAREPMIVTPVMLAQLIDSGEVVASGTIPMDWLGVPLRTADNPAMGALVVQTYTERRCYDQSDLDILTFVSSQVAVTIERRSLQGTIQKSEEKYRTLTDQLPIGVYRTSKAGTILHANPALAAMLGYDSVDELLGRSSLEHHTDVVIRTRQLEELAASGKIVHNEIPLVTGSGRRIFVRDTGRIILNDEGNIDHIDGVLEDITEQKRRNAVQQVLLSIAEKTSRAADLEDLLSHIQRQVGTLMDTRNFYVALVHDANAATFEFPFSIDENPEEVIEAGIPVDLSGGFSQYVQKTERPLLANRERAVEMITNGEIEMIGKVSESWLGVPLLDPEEGVMGVVAVQSYSDPNAYSEADQELLSIVSCTIAGAIKSKQAEAKRRTLEEKLARSEKMEAIGQLAGAVAHDLNNVLSAAVSLPDLLLQDLPDDSPLRRPIEIIQQSGLKASAIVEDLLTLARRGVPIKEVASLNELVRTYLKSPEAEKLLAYHPSVRIETDLDDDLLDIRGSFVHLNKTVMNLVSNAAEAMPEGGTVTVSTCNRYVDSTPIDAGHSLPEGDYVVLEVADQGVGIAASEIEKIFEPFYTKKVMGRSGTGLGMTVVSGTVQDHGGTIDVHSEAGRGTTFELLFPANKDGGDARSSEKPVVDVKGGGEKILVVDDINEQRAIAAAILGRLGYLVEVVASGEEAVEFIATQAVDLVVLDMIMEPGIDGLETFRRILALRPATRAIIVSGFSETGRVEEAMKLGAITYVKKPYTLQRIGLAVRGALEVPEPPPS